MVDSMVWLVQHAWANGLTSYSQIGAAIGRDKTTMHKALNGEYGASLDRIVVAVDRLRRYMVGITVNDGRPAAELSWIKGMGAFCDLARVTGSIGLIIGESQVGKTVALMRYAAMEREEKTIFVRMPPGGAKGMFMRDLAKACGIGVQTSNALLRDSILAYLKPGMLVVVDEFHECLDGSGAKGMKPGTVSQTRELRDVCKCAVILSGTKVVSDMFANERHERFLGQIGKRGVLKLEIPAVPTRADILLLAASWGFPRLEPGEARDRVESVATQGVGVLCHYFWYAARLARNKEQPVNWGHFLTALASTKAWTRATVQEQTWEQAEGKAYGE